MPTLLDRAIASYYGSSMVKEAPAEEKKKEPTAKAVDGTPVWSRGFSNFSSQGAEGEVDYRYDDNGDIVPVDAKAEPGPDTVPDDGEGEDGADDGEQGPSPQEPLATSYGSAGATFGQSVAMPDQPPPAAAPGAPAPAPTPTHAAADDGAAAVSVLGMAQDTIVARRYAGDAGIGGPVASLGEVLFCEQSQVFIEQGFDAYVKQHTADPTFKAAFERYSSTTHRAKLAYNARAKAALNIGWLDYNDGDDAHRRQISSYLASRDKYGQDTLEVLKNDPESVFNQKRGFNGNESSLKEWSDAAFDGAFTLSKKIKAGKSNIDPSRPLRVIQSDTDVDADLIRRIDQALERAHHEGDGESIAYYDGVKKAWDKFDAFHDTYALGEDEQGRIAVYHVSNKRGNSMKDPQANTTPIKKLKELMKSLQDSPLLQQTAPKVMKLVTSGIERLGDLQQASSKDAIGVVIDQGLVDLIDNMPPQYMGRVDKLVMAKTASGQRRKESLGWWMDQKGLNADGFPQLATSEKLGVIQNFMAYERDNRKKINYGTLTKLFMKAGEFGQKTNFRGQVTPAVQQCVEIKNGEKDATSTTYKNVQKAMVTADAKQGFPDAQGRNGAHVQVYVQSVMDALHLDTYIENFDKDAIIQMGVNGTEPSHIRQAMSQLMGYQGDLDTPEGRKGLSLALRQHARVDTTSGSIIITSPKGEFTLAEDIWRTAGVQGKVATHWGSDVRSTLTKLARKTGQG